MGLKHLMVCEPLELEYVAAGLGEHDVEILDLIVEKGLERRLNRFRPQVVATSSYITGVNEAIKVCRAAKRRNPEVWTVVGGVHASRVPEDFADPGVDVIALGDGATLMPELLDAIERGRPLEEVPGLALPSGGEASRGAEGDAALAFTPPRPYMPHPDTLPFPRRELTAHLRRKYYYLTHRPLALVKTAWGCWYRCGFCFNWQVTGGHAYLRSPESVVEELASIREDEVYIVDDIFLANRPRLKRMAELLREKGIRKSFLCFGRADFIAANEDVIAEWAALGLKAVLVGLEAATDRELESMEKRSSVDHNRRAVEVLRRHGVDTYGSLIPDPSYGPQEWARLWEFIEENGLYDLNLSPLTPFPGTALWDELKDRITVPREAHGLWDLSHAVLPTRQPLKLFYRSLLSVYTRAILDLRRAGRLTLRNRPPVWSPVYLRLWAGALRIWLQFRGAQRHHTPGALAEAMDRGAPVAPSPHRLLPSRAAALRAAPTAAPHAPCPSPPPAIPS
jgi:radical SAM superfamily enzyme YgiQ (UPF0313 family)